jgi:hypothetical protein
VNPRATLALNSSTVDLPSRVDRPQTRVTDIGGKDDVASTVRSDGTVQVTYGGKSTAISLADTKGNNPKLVRDLGITKVQATQILQDLRGAVPPPRKLLIGFAQNKGDPKAYLIGRLRDPAGEHRWPSDAFDKPPTEGIRLRARDPGVGAPETLNLSRYAYVFEEEASFTPTDSKTAIGVQEYQYPQYPGGPRGGSAVTRPRAVVEVNESGEIVEIVDHVMPGTPAEGRARLIALFLRVGWKVNLRNNQ